MKATTLVFGPTPDGRRPRLRAGAPARLRGERVYDQRFDHFTTSTSQERAMPTGTGQPPGMGGRFFSQFMDWPFEFRLLLVAAGLLVALSIGLSRLVQGHQGFPPPKWARKWGIVLEVGASAAAVGTAFGSALYAAWRDLEPEYGGILLAIVAILPGIIGIRSFIELGRQKSWVWIIRRGETIGPRMIQALLALDLAVILFVVLHMN